MGAVENRKDVENPGEQPCGQCLLCRYQALLDDIGDALEKLRKGRRKEAEQMLCTAIESGKGYLASGDWVAEDCDEDDDWEDEFDLADMPAAGRA